jgi:hypothetical protein
MSVDETAEGGESCFREASGTRGGGKTDLEEFGLEYRQGKYDWMLPGLGEPGEDCGKNRVPERNTVCPNGDSIRYEPLNCKKVECPDCYQGEQIERTFKIALEVEARAKVLDERPHAVVFSVPPDKARTWTYERLNTSLFRRGYRRMRKVGIDGGYAMFHPCRVQEARKKQLRRKGFGPGGSKGGYWNGVREDVLDLGDWREYSKFGPHGHNIGFPERIDPHESDDFLVKKYASLDTLDDLIGHIRYLLTHRGVRNGEDVSRSVRSWGAFHHGSDNWMGAKEELSKLEYSSLAQKIAGKLGKKWNPETEELETESEHECPECGTPLSDFYSLHDLPEKMQSQVGEKPWINELDIEKRSFVKRLMAEWRYVINNEDKNHIVLDDLDPPDSVETWSIEDMPE